MRLCPLYVCMEYKTVNKLLYDFDTQFDEVLLSWKDEVEEEGSKKKSELLSVVQDLKSNNDPRLEEARNMHWRNMHWRINRATMHRGYSLTRDSVDMRILLCHMTTKSKAKVYYKIVHGLSLFIHLFICFYLPIFSYY